MGRFVVGSESTLEKQHILDTQWYACLTIGVPYFVYWERPIHELDHYLKAYMERERHENRRFEEQAWILGQYVQKAVSNAFNGGSYPKEPIEFYSKGEEIDKITEIEKKEKQEKKEEMLLKAVMFKYSSEMEQKD